MKQRTNNLLSLFTLCLGAAAAFGCAAEPKMSGVGGSGGGGGAGGGGMVSGVTLVPSATGWVDKMDAGNTVGVQGAWYPYGDAYGEAKCMAAGHTAAECSVIIAPDPLAMAFPNTGGVMCTEGTVGKILNGANGMPDYSNMWGAGIGLDLNATGGDNSEKLEWDADANGVKGIAFNIDTVPLPGLRVEFPIPSTEGGTAGSNYWGATGMYPNSPVKMGTNVVLWDQVKAPVGGTGTASPDHQKHLLSIQFHVPASTASAGPYKFCISNLTFLTM
jgi:hypothetical protein